jgi:protein-disulfide isomerase
LKAQIELAKSAGIRGTPAFLFNSKVLSNAQFSKIMEKAYQMAQEKP